MIELINQENTFDRNFDTIIIIAIITKKYFKFKYDWSTEEN